MELASEAKGRAGPRNPMEAEDGTGVRGTSGTVAGRSHGLWEKRHRPGTRPAFCTSTCRWIEQAPGPDTLTHCLAMVDSPSLGLAEQLAAARKKAYARRSDRVVCYAIGRSTPALFRCAADGDHSCNAGRWLMVTYARPLLEYLGTGQSADCHRGAPDRRTDGSVFVCGVW